MASTKIARLRRSNTAPRDTETKSEADHPRLHIPTLATLSSDFRTLFINTCLLLVFLLLVPVLATQFLRSQIIIEPIGVPPELVARGLTSDVASNRIWDGLHEETEAARSSKAAIAVIPNDQRVDFAIPDSGLSIDSLVYYVRQFFHNYETRIGGEFRCNDNDCAPAGMSLRLRIFSDHLNIIQLPPMGTTSEADYYRTAALQILKVLDPFTASAAQADTNADEARAIAERLILTHHPDAKWAYNLKGNLDKNEKNLDAAVADYEAALQIDPGFSLARTNLCIALVAKHDLPAAAKAFDLAATIDPNDSHLAIGRAQLARANGDSAGAVKYLLAADQTDPGTERYLLMAAQDELDAGHLVEATDFAERARVLSPGDETTLTMLALLEMQSNRFDLAETTFRRGVAFASDNANLQGQFAGILLANKKFDEALVHADLAHRLSPGTQSYVTTQGRALLALKRFGEASTHLLAAQALAPLDNSASVDLADAYSGLGRKAEASALYRQVIDADPTGPTSAIARVGLRLLNLPDAVVK
jgi:tetratricopeptide (TPR) repeat protein